MTQIIETGVVALTALGGGLGLAKLLAVRATNKKINSESDKTDAEREAIFIGATAVFSDSVLKMLHQAQASADKAQTTAERAVREAQMCKEEVSYLRRWIIEQGLTPPTERRSDEQGYSSA